MDKVKISLEDGVEVEVNCIFYLYNSKYYFLYTLNELDENGYVRLYLVKVGKEAANSENGQIETGNMIGIEVPTDEEWKEVQHLLCDARRRRQRDRLDLSGEDELHHGQPDRGRKGRALHHRDEQRRHPGLG